MFKELLHKRSFDRIFRENYARLYRYALYITGDSETSRDIVSDVFAGLWKNFASVDMDRLNAYLLTSVRNRCVDYLRVSLQASQYTEEYISCYSELYTDYTDELEKDRLVERLLAQLPPYTRQILELCYLQRKKYAEAAVELGISPETVKKHIVKALKMLKELYNCEKEQGRIP